jgi:hypothetical protein
MEVVAGRRSGHCRAVPILPDPDPPAADPRPAVAAWGASGAMALTGRADGLPLGPPAGLVERVDAIGGRLARAGEALGGHLAIDPLALLGERAALAGLRRRGATSCGGATRLVPCQDGWFALTLARPDDVALLPAWLELGGPPPDPWSVIEATVAGRAGGELLDRARLLGLPAAGLPAERTARPPDAVAGSTALGEAAPLTGLAGVRVVELGALWAGPLCGSLLAQAGADVVKVESTTRPDGARRGAPAFFDLCNAGKRSAAIDLATPDGREALRAIVAGADVVIEASRPRALEQLGLDATALVAGGGPRAWASITGHGRSGPARDWVGFGDDAAVAGGLVAWDDGGPLLCADAVADPLTGLVAAVAVLEALAAGGRHLLDVPLAAVAAHLAGPTLPVTDPIAVAEPRARPVTTPGPAFGEHTLAVVAERHR